MTTFGLFDAKSFFVIVSTIKAKIPLLSVQKKRKMTLKVLYFDFRFYFCLASTESSSIPFETEGLFPHDTSCKLLIEYI